MTPDQANRVIWEAINDPGLSAEQKYAVITEAKDESAAWLAERIARPPVAESLLDNPVVRWAE